MCFFNQQALSFYPGFNAEYEHCYLQSQTYTQSHIFFLYCSSQTKMLTPCSSPYSTYRSNHCNTLCPTALHTCWTRLARHMVTYIWIACSTLLQLESANIRTAHIQSILKALESMTSVVRHVLASTRSFKAKVSECICGNVCVSVHV